MNYIVFDLEWNQPISAEAAIREPVYLEGEIVEIGAVKLNDRFEPVDEIRIYIRPQYYARMHKGIASLTGVSDRVLAQQGVPFPEAYGKFADFCGEEYTFMTWSTSDLPILLDNMRLHNIDVSGLPDVIDVQRIFDREIMRSAGRTNLDHALEVLGIRGEKAHDALNDSRNTVAVCSRMDLDAYIDDYITRPFLDLSLEKVYAAAADAFADDDARKLGCPWCGGETVCEPWVRAGRQGTAARGLCECGGEFLMFMHCKPCLPEGFRAERLGYEMSNDLWDQYCDWTEAQ